MNSLYVDDVNTGGYSVEEVNELFNKSRQWMSGGGFNVRKWNSNSDELLKRVEEFEECRDNNVLNESATEDEQSYAKATVGKGTSTKDSDNKVLGFIWNTKIDALSIKFCEIVELAKSLSETKRNVFKVIAKLFDPLGLVTPISTPLKVLMQELFQSKYKWDKHFSDDLARRWNCIIKELEQLNQIKVPRYYFQDIQEKPEKRELFGFCDSSERAYAAVVYVKVTLYERSAIALVTSKSCMAPLSRQTIHWLELLSRLIIARLITSVKETLSSLFKVEIVRCWTDSITTYHWIQSAEKQWKLFVENCIQEIRKFVPPDIWCHFPGVENPADIPTRKVKFANLAVNSVWWHGAEWLLSSEDMWPTKKRILDPPDHCVSEMKETGRNSQLALHAQAERCPHISRIIDCKRYSSLSKLLRVTSYVVRFVKNCRSKRPNLDELTSGEQREAETFWVRDMQSCISKEKLKDLEKHVGNFKDEEGIIRCQGRLANSSLSYDARFPILLPKEHYVTYLIIWNCHKRVLHNGTKETLQELSLSSTSNFL